MRHQNYSKIVCDPTHVEQLYLSKSILMYAIRFVAMVIMQISEIILFIFIRPHFVTSMIFLNVTNQD